MLQVSTISVAYHVKPLRVYHALSGRTSSSSYREASNAFCSVSLIASGFLGEVFLEFRRSSDIRLRSLGSVLIVDDGIGWQASLLY